MKRQGKLALKRSIESCLKQNAGILFQNDRAKPLGKQAFAARYSPGFFDQRSLFFVPDIKVNCCRREVSMPHPALDQIGGNLLQRAAHAEGMT